MPWCLKQTATVIGTSEMPQSRETPEPKVAGVSLATYTPWGISKVWVAGESLGASQMFRSPLLFWFNTLSYLDKMAYANLYMCSRSISLSATSRPFLWDLGDFVTVDRDLHVFPINLHRRDYRPRGAMYPMRGPLLSTVNKIPMGRRR